MKRRIQTPAPRQGKNVKLAESHNKLPDFTHPVFCFKYLHKDYGLEQCSDQEKKSLIEQIIQISRCDWHKLQLSPRHGIGSEKIEISSLRNGVSIPYDLTEDVNFLIAFRFDGMKPIIGHRNKFIFHVFFIDRDFTLYRH
ncbi:MAG: hypothetical protein LBH06_04695 [Rikenellaceae bacterium]|jgi:hypothetical protein|nr:hypothetical protein [Rikenellaceae bacterium]